MRKAKIDHAWNKCRTTRDRLSIDEILISGAADSKKLAISSRVTAFVGANGAGKTSLLRSLQQLLSRPRCDGASPRVDAVSGRWNGKAFRVPESEATERCAPETQLIDASAEAHKLLEFFDAQQGLDELLQAHGSKRCNESETARFQYLCGKKYDYIDVTEVEGPPLDSESLETSIAPFFGIGASNGQYDTRSMGFGELCAFYVVWALGRASKGSIVLLDEPDSHLSPKARRSLPHVIAQIAAERELWIAFTTHSIEPLEPLRESEFYLVESSYSPPSYSVTPAGARRRALRALGITPIKRLLLVVEDVDAEVVAAMILNRLAEDVLGAIDIQRMVKGASEIISFVKAFPSASLIGRCVALLDGDKREEFGGHDFVLFLPGSQDPIAAARAAVTADPGSFSKHLGIDESRAVAALNAVQHIDHHDLCASLLEELTFTSTSVADIRKALISCWLADDSVLTEARKLADDFVKIVDRLPFSDWELPDRNH